ncbi:MAG: tyrosine-protein kinase family protein [Terriglobia bacterium]
MSRIHEAIKRAEQDRDASRAELGVPVQGTALGETDERSLVAPAALPLPAPETSAGVTLESWIASCPATAWKPDPRSLLFSNPAAGVEGMEEFRTLRTQLTHLRDKLPLQTVLVASPLPGEGKTFVAANLAQAFVQQRGRRVLLIDADLRLSRLHSVLGAARTPGLSDFLAGKADVSEILQRGEADNLFFIPGGRPVPNPTELVANGRLKGLLHRLAPLFDWIVTDSPPCVPVSDASVLAEFYDGVLMVVCAGKTPFDMAQKGAQQFREKRLLGVVLNQADSPFTYNAYYYQTATDRAAERLEQD